MITKKYDSQTGTFLAGIAQSMPQISGEEMQYWISKPAELKKALAQVFGKQKPQQVLRRGEIVLLPAQTDPVDPQTFTTEDGLCVWGEYTDRILSVAQPVASLPEISIMHCDLARNATDAQNRAELPEGHVWEASEFAARLNGMIRRQWGGTAGVLLNNGYANIFYVRGKTGEVFAVYVYWDADGSGWRVDAYALGDVRWGEGGRVFSRTAVA